MTLEIPVTEGDAVPRRGGQVRGLDRLQGGLRRGPLFKLQPGDVYNESKLKKGFDKLRDLYGSVGYFQWTGATKKKPDPEKKVVDVTLAMEEDKRYFVGRIKFTGNESTRDKVIRREIYMNEGDVFNTEPSSSRSSGSTSSATSSPWKARPSCSRARRPTTRST